MTEGKTYWLWLDESGTFEEDPGETRNGPSLVGGVWCEDAVRRAVRPASIPAERVGGNPRFRDAFPGTARPEVSHSAELPKSIRTAARAAVVQGCVEQGLEFVFFQNRSKIRIQDSTITYLNFLAEGLAQFMAHLSVQGPAHLEVVIGRRVDVAAYEREKQSGQPARKRAITEEEYLSRIDERIALARARYLFDGANRVTYHVGFDKDKGNPFLILSDYVCSCKFTLDSADARTQRSFDTPDEGGLTCREQVTQIFQTRSMTFGLVEDRLLRDVRGCLSGGNWGGALYLALAGGVPVGSMHRELSENFAALNAQGQRVQMDVFFQLAGHLAQVEGAHRQTAALLEAYLDYLAQLEFRFEEDRTYCVVNAKLYLSAALSHMGRTAQGQDLLEQCEGELPALLRRPENWLLYYILRNRKAVDLQDCFDYEGALALLDEALCVAELEREGLHQLYEALSLPVEDAPLDQQARLLGNRALTLQYLLPSSPQRAEEAREAAQKAIAAFPYPEDQHRHWMALMTAELYRNDLEAALQAFQAGLGCTQDTLMKMLEASGSAFDWYPVIQLAEGMLGGSHVQQKLGQELFSLIRARFDRVFQGTYPAHSAARRMAQLARKAGCGTKTIQRYDSICEKLCFQEENRTGPLWVIGLASLADRIVADGNTAPELKARFWRRFDEAWDSELPRALRRFYQRAKGWCEQDGADLYVCFSRWIGH